MTKKEEVFIPMNKRLVIEPIKDAVTKAGIILPGKKDDLPYEGIVKFTMKGSDIKVDDKILFNRHASIKFDKYPEYLVIKEEDIYLIIK